MPNMKPDLVPCSVLVTRSAIYISPCADDGGMDVIAVMNTNAVHRTSGEILAYARAFAAGPEMIKALESAVIALRGVEHKQGIQRVIDEVEAALAKGRFGLL